MKRFSAAFSAGKRREGTCPISALSVSWFQQAGKSEFVRNSKFKFILLESVFREIKICYRFFPQGKDMCDMLLLLKKRRFVQKVEMV